MEADAERVGGFERDEQGRNMNEKIIIDKEFAALIIPPSPDELNQLEKNMLADGCRDAIVVWAGHDILLDGHTRYALCAANKLPYAVKAVKLPDRQAAIFWIIKNQLGRRNLTPWARAELALKLKPQIERGISNLKREFSHLPPSERKGKGKLYSDPMGDTGTQLAKAAGLGRVTMYRAITVAEHADDAAKARLRTGETTIGHEYQQIKGQPSSYTTVANLRTALEQIAHYEKPDGDSYAHALDFVQNIAARALEKKTETEPAKP